MLHCAANFCREKISMKRFLLGLTSSTAMLLIGGCAVPPPEMVLAQVDDIATGALQTRPAVIEMDGKPTILYSTKADRVALRIGDQIKLLDETARVKQGGSYFQLQSNGKDLRALWWSHQDGKNIYFTSSADGGRRFEPVSMVNEDHGVLPPFTVTSGPEGVVGVTYHDERLPNYQAFFNRSVDGGRTWPIKDQRLDTPPVEARSTDVHEPQSVQTNSVWISAWTDSVRRDGRSSFRIVSRRSDDAGLSWTQPVVLYSSDHQISSLVVKADANNIVMAADDLERGIFALTSLDNGRSWSNTGILAATDHASNSGINLTLFKQRAHLVWMQERAGEKIRIMAASLDIAQTAWLEAVQRVDVKSHDNTRSISPVVMATSEGVLLAAWVDYRDIRPNIYLAASYDQGRSWSTPRSLLAPGEVSAGWPQLVRWADQAAISYEIYPTDRILNGKLVVRRISLGDSSKGLVGLHGPSLITENERAARLASRVKAMWDARLAAEYDKAYDMFDFAYKASTPKKYYLENVGSITYLSFSVDDIAITGNEASVRMKLKYEVKPTIIPMTGKPLSVPPVDVESPSTWVWVGGDWYMVYAPSFEPPQLKY